MKLVTLKENHLFAKSYSKGKRCVTPTVVLYTLRDLHAGLLKKQHPRKITQNRIGLTVTKKQGGAVVRNRIKRRLRAAYTQLYQAYPVKTGQLIVLVARSETKDAPYEKLVSDLFRAMKQTGLIKEEVSS